MNINSFLDEIKKGNHYYIARAISILENKESDYKEVLKRIYPLKKSSIKIGITGAPGSGKSSLTNKLIEKYLKENKRIGVLAVDPSSPISGGALLGDRLRMIGHSNNDNVFIRSLASRGSIGGLNSSIFEIIDLLDYAGFDIVLIETVGVGQSEIDIVNVADMVLMLLTPSSGDEIQMFKAGIVEIADIFVINKVDLGNADKKELEIKNYFALTDTEPIISKTSVKESIGIDELVKNINEFYINNKERIEEKKRRLKKQFVLKIIMDKVNDYFNYKINMEELLNQGLDPMELAGLIIKGIKNE